MTPAVLGAFGFLWNLNATVVSMQQGNQRRDDDIRDIKLRIETVRNDVSANTLEIVRVKAECDNHWNDIKKGRL